MTPVEGRPRVVHVITRLIVGGILHCLSAFGDDGQTLFERKRARSD